MLISFVGWSFEPLNLNPENNLPIADVVYWFAASLPGHHLGPLHTLVKALAQLVNQKETTLRQQVYTLVMLPPESLHGPLDSWLKRCQISIEKYAKTVLLSTKQVDDFFMLCVSCKFAMHLAMIHMDGIWSTYENGALQDGDLMLAQTTDGFREVLKIKDDVQIYDTLGDTSYLDTVWTNQPPWFTAPVADPMERANDAGYNIHPGEKPCPLKSILADLMGISEKSYYFFARKWFHDNFFNHRIALHWWE